MHVFKPWESLKHLGLTLHMCEIFIFQPCLHKSTMDVVSTTLILFQLNHLIRSLSEVLHSLCVTRSQGWVPLNDAL
jgi:hypothetical protein